MICHYFFFNYGFKFQDSVCNGCHDLPMLSINISDVAVITVKNVSKSDAINLLKFQNEKSRNVKIFSWSS